MRHSMGEEPESLRVPYYRSWPRNLRTTHRVLQVWPIDLRFRSWLSFERNVTTVGPKSAAGPSACSPAFLVGTCPRCSSSLPESR